jgi:hypothetical protein
MSGYKWLRAAFNWLRPKLGSNISLDEVAAGTQKALDFIIFNEKQLD